jgi:hypothetical protein
MYQRDSGGGQNTRSLRIGRFLDKDAETKNSLCAEEVFFATGDLVKD